jgi:hypothetical protein
LLRDKTSVTATLSEDTLQEDKAHFLDLETDLAASGPFWESEQPERLEKRVRLLEKGLQLRLMLLKIPIRSPLPMLNPNVLTKNV